jgi:hypothetical protein
MADLKDLLKKMNDAVKDPSFLQSQQPKKDFPSLDDENFYKISKSKDGSGLVKIRFIPSLSEDKTRLNTFVTQQLHNVRGSKDSKKFIRELCPKTVAPDSFCPICSYTWDNWRLLNNEGKAKVDGVSTPEAKHYLQFSAKSEYITNILIVDDTVDPANNGKVFKYRFSAQIYNKIQFAIAPDKAETIKNPDIEPFNPWDLDNGKDFWLELTPSAKTANGFPTWDKSTFVVKSRVVEGQDALIENAFTLDYLIDGSQLRPVDELEKTLLRFLGKEQPKEQPKKETSAKVLNDLNNELPAFARDNTVPRPEIKVEIEDQPPFEVDEPKKEEKKQQPANSLDALLGELGF